VDEALYDDDDDDDKEESWDRGGQLLFHAG
jgi:hypothetical protein